MLQLHIKYYRKEHSYSSNLCELRDVYQLRNTRQQSFCLILRVPTTHGVSALVYSSTTIAVNDTLQPDPSEANPEV